MNRLYISCSAAALATILSTGGAAAAAFSFDGVVVSSEITAGSFSFGAPGNPVSALFEITAAPGEALPLGPMTAGTIDLELTSADFEFSLSDTPQGANDGFSTSLEVDASGLRLATSAGLFDWTGYAPTPTQRSVFTVTFGETLMAAPTTYDALIAALSAPGASAGFVTSGDFTTFDGSSFSSFEAELSAAVPAPAAALSLLAGLGALLGLRRRAG